MCNGWKNSRNIKGSLKQWFHAFEFENRDREGEVIIVNNTPLLVVNFGTRYKVRLDSVFLAESGSL